MSSFQPAYRTAYENGTLQEKIKVVHDRLKSCDLCPRKCNVNRLAGETGVCKTAGKAYVSSYNAHFGEEAPLVGNKGSGTIFFTHCNLMCNFCQNYDISHEGHGQEVTDEALAQMMIALQNIGCHNINFVTPSHVVPQILSALTLAISEGLSVPLVYNTGGYDRVSTLKLLEGIFDIYMPDFKFWDPDVADKTCDAKNYPAVAQKAFIEMHRQVGDLVTDASGVAQKGLLIRHLVLPNGLAGTKAVMRFIANNLSTNSYENVMSQYRPCGRAAEVKKLASAISSKDFEIAIQEAEAEGITRLDKTLRAFMLW